MADTPLDQRRFTDKEVREILKEAVETTPSRSLARGEGVSLAELKAIGQEVGIDPARLEDAARAVTREDRNRTHKILGGPTVLNFERKVEGEFDADDTTDMIACIRRIMGRRGEVRELHGSLEWSDKGESGERYVTLSSRDGTTTIRSSANLSQAATVTFLPAGIVGSMASFLGLVMFAKKGSEVGLIVALTVLPLLYPILRTIFKRFSGSESGRLQQVVDDLALLTEEARD